MRTCFRAFSIAALVVLCGCAYLNPGPGTYGQTQPPIEMTEHERAQADVQRVQQGLNGEMPK